MITRYMWSSSPEGAKLFETENEAYHFAEFEGIDDYAIEKIAKNDHDYAVET